MKISHQILRALLASNESMSTEDFVSATGLDKKQIAGNTPNLMKQGIIANSGEHGGALYSIGDRDAVAKRLDGKKDTAPTAKKKRKAAVQRPVNGAQHANINARKLEYFIGETGGLRIVRADGDGVPALIEREEALRLRDFLNQCTVLLEPEE